MRFVSSLAGTVASLSLLGLSVVHHVGGENENLASRGVEFEVGVVVVENIANSSRSVLQTHIKNVCTSQVESDQKGQQIVLSQCSRTSLLL